MGASNVRPVELIPMLLDCLLLFLKRTSRMKKDGVRRRCIGTNKRRHGTTFKWSYTSSLFVNGVDVDREAMAGKR